MDISLLSARLLQALFTIIAVIVTGLCLGKIGVVVHAHRKQAFLPFLDRPSMAPEWVSWMNRNSYGFFHIRVYKSSAHISSLRTKKTLYITLCTEQFGVVKSNEFCGTAWMSMVCKAYKGSEQLCLFPQYDIGK